MTCVQVIWILIGVSVMSQLAQLAMSSLVEELYNTSYVNAVWLNLLTDSEAAQTMHDIMMRCAVSWPMLKSKPVFPTSYTRTSPTRTNMELTLCRYVTLLQLHMERQHIKSS